MSDNLLNISGRPGVALRAENLGRHFRSDSPRRGAVKAVDGVSFEINRGQTFGLVGESGCGKSTLARMLVGLESPSFGRVSLAGQPYDPHTLRKRRDLRAKIQMVFQDPFASLNPSFNIAKIIGEPIRMRAPGARDIQALAAEYLLQVGLSDQDLMRYPHQFSGGQRQRISIARALASQPEILICDEPTSALDVSVQAQILNLLKDLQEQRGLTYCFISHNLAVVYHMADTVGVMYLGKLVEIASKHALFENPRHPYTRLLLDSVPKLDSVARPELGGELRNPADAPGGCSFFSRCPIAGDRCKSEPPNLRLQKDGSAVACHAIGESAVAAAIPIMSLRQERKIHP